MPGSGARAPSSSSSSCGAAMSKSEALSRSSAWLRSSRASRRSLRACVRVRASFAASASLARGEELAAALRLPAAQLQLTFGDADDLPVVEHLQEERHDVDREVFAGAFEVLHGGRQVELAAPDRAVDAQPLEERHRGRDVEAPGLERLRLVGVVVARTAAERGVVAQRGAQVGQTAEAGRREVVVLLLDLQRLLPHVGVVAQGVSDAVVERPRGARRRLLRGGGQQRARGEEGRKTAFVHDA